ncbi:MAG TPA: DUF1501 domain-containing protein [Myxococcaceae bacterium]|nr:DUF1501 domain-containing protein [Myxococcaceae bacterium]
MRISRREFLEGLGAVGLAASLSSRLGDGRAWAQSAPDYRALVCVFLFGGNDGNNLVVPVDTAGYAAYAAARGTGTGGLALAQSSLLPLTPASGAAAYGFHPNLVELQALWEAGALGVVFNVGTLLAPTSKATFLSNAVPQPLSLLSHQDQQHQWQTALSDQYSRSGWGGRIADGLAAAPLPPVISIAGNQLFGVGNASSPLGLPAAGGGFGLAGFDGSAEANARLQAMDDVRMLEEQNLIVRATQSQASTALSASKLIAPVLGGSGSTVDSLFAGLTSSIAKQLLQVARIIAARQTLGAARQIFFVSQDGYDTHNDQLNRQGNLLADLSPALKAFYDATVQLGVAGQVTTFTLSDFARTLQPASGGGSDHAWGNHQLVLGGAVRGRQTYGTFPTLQLGGPDDFSGQGRWVPTLAVDQYAATLATWFGVSAADLPTVIPYIGRYATADLGFLG